MKIETTLKELRSRNETALIAYQTYGYPDAETSLDNLESLVRAGADILEVGFPFSDPIADGPVIQFASQTALEKGVTLAGLFESLAKRKLSVPLVLMSYLNPLLAYGKETLIRDINRAGISGLIVPDLPADDAEDILPLSGSDVEPVFLAARTSSKARIQLSVDRTGPFLYCVSTVGTTGVREKLPEGLIEWLDELRKMTDKPLAVGFGVSKPEHIRELHGHADAVIVASRLIEAIRNGENLEALVRSLKKATLGE
jgi:tryptophan synthase alpha chain